MAVVAVVDVEALPKRAPEKFIAVRIDVDGLYVTAVFVNAFVVPTPVANSNGKFVLALDEVIPMLVAFVAVPVKDPKKSVAVNLPVTGEYDKAVGVLSRYNV